VPSGSKGPLVYLVQTRGFFRAVGVGGFALFTLFVLCDVAAHGALPLLFGVALFAAAWFDTSLMACRRCRHYGSWHCVGQGGMLVSGLFARVSPGVSDGRIVLHFGLLGAYLLYGLFWLWHSIAMGSVFTLWLPVAALSALPPGGFSWRKGASISKAA
jgi:hypothetical protein